METNRPEGRIPREGVRELATASALRTLLKRPRWFLWNLRQWPEGFRDRRHRTGLEQFKHLLRDEAEAVELVTGRPRAEYRRATEELRVPDPHPGDPRSHWAGRIELLRVAGGIVRLTRPQVVVETGVALGFTTATILAALEDNHRGRLHSIDLPGLQYGPSEEVGAVVPDHLRHRWSLQLGDSKRLLGPLVEVLGRVDVFLHDAWHTYSSMLREYRTVWPVMPSGGVLISDDVDNPAFVEFAAEVSAEPFLVRGPSRESAIGLLRKG